MASPKRMEYNVFTLNKAAPFTGAWEPNVTGNFYHEADPEFRRKCHCHALFPPPFLPPYKTSHSPYKLPPQGQLLTSMKVGLYRGTTTKGEGGVKAKRGKGVFKTRCREGGI